METQYPLLRTALRPELVYASDEFIEQAVAEVHGTVTAEDLENFWKSISRVARAAAPIVSQAGQIAGRALPGVIQGATAGAALGPYGMLAGGLLGGVGSALAPTPSAPAVRPGPPRPAAPRYAPAPALPNRAPTYVPRAPQQSAVLVQQLLTLLTDPAVQQALMAASMGRHGRRTVETIAGPVAPSRVAQSIADIADEVADSAGHQHIRSVVRVQPPIVEEPTIDPLDVFDMSFDELDELLTEELFS